MMMLQSELGMLVRRQVSPGDVLTHVGDVELSQTDVALETLIMGKGKDSIIRLGFTKGGPFGARPAKSNPLPRLCAAVKTPANPTLLAAVILAGCTAVHSQWQ